MKAVDRMDSRRIRELPDTERDLLLEQAASIVGRDYGEGGSLRVFEAFGEGDHHDISAPED